MSGELLTTREAAELLGVSPTSIKRWADEGVLEHVRTHGEHRRFSADALEKVRRALEAGVPLERAAAPAERSEDEEWLDRFASDPDPLRVVAKLLDERIARGSHHRAADAVAKLFVEIGRRWEAGELTILEEHAMSAAFERGLTIVKEQMIVSKKSPRCLLATVEGEEHVLGLQLAELCVREAGWRTIYAGRSTPIDEIMRAIEKHDAEMIVLSASTWFSDKKVLARSAKKIAERAVAQGVLLVLGGAGAWPGEVDGAERVRTFAELADLLAAQQKRGR